MTSISHRRIVYSINYLLGVLLEGGEIGPELAKNILEHARKNDIDPEHPDGIDYLETTGRATEIHYNELQTASTGGTPIKGSFSLSFLRTQTIAPSC